MVALGECNGCQMGDHSRYQQVVRAVPEGVFGGVICRCKGGCVARGPRLDPYVELLADVLLKQNKEEL